jgi:hypothetical protein
MINYNLSDQEAIGDQLIEDIYQINYISPGVGAVCQVCETAVEESERVCAYVFRRCPHSSWAVGQVRCADHPLSLDSLASLGVRELAVTARVGTCTDQALQRSWPVLLAPEVNAVSPADSDTAATLPGVTAADVTECPIARATPDDHPVFSQGVVAE